MTGNTINTLDPTLPGSTREAFGLSMNVYDRLVTFERKPNGQGFIFDFEHMRGELAQSFDIGPDGLTITFHLRPDATWHDGTKVTAEDVKWSLDRTVSAKSLAAPQVNTGSLMTPDQFTIIDPMTVQVKLAGRIGSRHRTRDRVCDHDQFQARPRPRDRGRPVGAGLAEGEHGGGGAYTIESFKPGEQVILRRNEAWRSGKDGQLPFFKPHHRADRARGLDPREPARPG